MRALLAVASAATVSAVGHETDTPLTDLVADVRAKTPTFAAELVVPHRGELDDARARVVDLLGRVAARATADARRGRVQRTGRSAMRARAGGGGPQFSEEVEPCWNPPEQYHQSCCCADRLAS